MVEFASEWFQRIAFSALMPWPKFLAHKAPMAAGALPKPQARALHGDAPPSATQHSLVRSFLEIHGWFEGQWRLDAWFAFIGISQQISTNSTPVAWRCPVQACSCLLHTRHYRLTYRRARPARGGSGADVGFLSQAAVGSSSLNSGAGCFGGSCMGGVSAGDNELG